MLFVGDDWAEDHHDIEVQDGDGRVLRRTRLPEGIAGIDQFAAIVVEFLDEDAGPDQVLVCIEVDHGAWVHALIAAGYRVFGVDPKQAQRHREILASSQAKSDKGDAHALADMVRTRHQQLRESGGDSDIAESIKVTARAHQSMIWERTRHMLRMRAALTQYFPALGEAAAAVGLELTSTPILTLLTRAATPQKAAKLTRSQIVALLAGRRNKDAKAELMQQILRAPHLELPQPVTEAYAATVRAQVAVLTVLVEQIDTLADEVAAHFSRHPDHEIYQSIPGMGPIVGPRVLAEFGDDPHRYRNSKARKNYAGTSPITIQSGKSRIVTARYIHNSRLIDAAMAWAHGAMMHDPDARAYYRKQRDRGIEHNAALRQLANRLVGILHGCLATHTPYNPDTAWKNQPTATAA